MERMYGVNPLEGIGYIVLDYGDGTKRRVLTTMNIDILYQKNIRVPEDYLYDFERKLLIPLENVESVYIDNGDTLDDINEFIQAFL